ncbi:hypothetical protein TPHA_0L01070 [Tetrapisispora phaffii CBS 4417]|uniref:Uncharacterized protein n=1 Tax=Tetrapisispora phaffii (strain ATCC 24235 / CBS 4417 / NBRC 1672 / NRRL Y-8282 / UCD 70-5) TaxID=1071381 RepID=G8BZY6_TETPH|nr:hypothetical protein TPHA_0L01070 [Tetrapisispora phaffii CBS 4417]CCE65464.1 hypothetical protein TPHA_0L01070 [Tetrapisispora phaffii CBS 4417]
MFDLVKGNKNKIRFIPFEEASSNCDGNSKDQYTSVNTLEQMQWYVYDHSKEPIESPDQEKTGELRRSSGSFTFLNKLSTNPETRLETQTIYFTDLKTGKAGFVQVVYSSMMNALYKGFQLNFKLFDSNDRDNHSKDIWQSFKLSNLTSFSPLKVEFDNVKFEFIESKSDKKEVFSQLIVHVDIENTEDTAALKLDMVIDLFPGYVTNPDGCSYYLERGISKEESEDKSAQFSSNKMMRHLFVPRARCTGKLYYKDIKGNNEIELELDDVPTSYIDAVQGLLPNKAARAWNFLCYHSKSWSILCMEFTTTAEYNNHTVTTWAVTKNDKLVKVCSAVDKHSVKYLKTSVDKENNWKPPSKIEFPMKFTECDLNLVNRYDIMNELPLVVRKIAQNIAHVKPYIYQYCQQSKYENEKGISIIESTFIS